MTPTDTPRTDAATTISGDVKSSFARDLERELAEVTAAIHKVHPTRRGSLVDMVEDLDSYRETAMNAFRLSEKLLAAERATVERMTREHEASVKGIEMIANMLYAERELADRLALTLDDVRYYDGLSPTGKAPVMEALAAWKEARREAGDPP